MIRYQGKLLLSLLVSLFYCAERRREGRVFSDPLDGVVGTFRR